MKRLLVKLVKFYQLSISPLKAPCCKYYPTCSNYAIEAIERFGAFKGFFMAIYRILRCNPFSKGGYDPVPEKKEKQRREPLPVEYTELQDRLRAATGLRVTLEGSARKGRIVLQYESEEELQRLWDWMDRA